MVLAAGLVALLLAGSADAADPPRPLPVLEAQVTRINDGDSIEVELDSGHARVRFSAIDTPEYDQPYGAQSSAALKAMLPLGSKVELEVVTQDSVPSPGGDGVADRRRQAHQHQRGHAARGPCLGLSALHEGSEVLRHGAGSARRRS